MSTPLHRLFLVSDMHYTTEETRAEMKLIDPTVDVSLAAGPAFGHTQREKIDRITADVKREHEISPLSAVLILGDLSIDDYDVRRLKTNYCRRFKEECMDLLPVPAYAGAGNHDSYPSEMWKEIFGYEREFAFEVGGIVFLMLDTFCSFPARGASGSDYTGVDMKALERTMEKHRGKKIVLLAHHFAPEKESEAFCRFVREEDSVLALFRGHTHKHAVLYAEEYWGKKPLIDIGGYAYCGMKRNGTYTFDIFDEAWAWGYQTVDIYEDRLVVKHHTIENHYTAENGTFDIPGSVSDYCEIPFS